MGGRSPRQPHGNYSRKFRHRQLEENIRRYLEGLRVKVRGDTLISRAEKFVAGTGCSGRGDGAGRYARQLIAFLSTTFRNGPPLGSCALARPGRRPLLLCNSTTYDIYALELE